MVNIVVAAALLTVLGARATADVGARDLAERLCCGQSTHAFVDVDAVFVINLDGAREAADALRVDICVLLAQGTCLYRVSALTMADIGAAGFNFTALGTPRGQATPQGLTEAAIALSHLKATHAAARTLARRGAAADSAPTVLILEDDVELGAIARLRARARARAVHPGLVNSSLAETARRLPAGWSYFQLQQILVKGARQAQRRRWSGSGMGAAVPAEKMDRTCRPGGCPPSTLAIGAGAYVLSAAGVRARLRWWPDAGAETFRLAETRACWRLVPERCDNGSAWPLGFSFIADMCLARPDLYGTPVSGAEVRQRIAERGGIDAARAAASLTCRALSQRGQPRQNPRDTAWRAFLATPPLAVHASPMPLRKRRKAPESEQRLHEKSSNHRAVVRATRQWALDWWAELGGAAEGGVEPRLPQPARPPPSPIPTPLLRAALVPPAQCALKAWPPARSALVPELFAFSTDSVIFSARALRLFRPPGGGGLNWARMRAEGIRFDGVRRHFSAQQPEGVVVPTSTARTESARLRAYKFKAVMLSAHKAGESLGTPAATSTLCVRGSTLLLSDLHGNENIAHAARDTLLLARVLRTRPPSEQGQLPLVVVTDTRQRVRLSEYRREALDALLGVNASARGARVVFSLDQLRTLAAQHGASAVWFERVLQKVIRWPAERDDAAYYRARAYSHCAVDPSARPDSLLVEVHGGGTREWTDAPAQIVASVAARSFGAGLAVQVRSLQAASFCEQVRLFARARVAVLHHGAAVGGNAVFLRADALLIEVAPLRPEGAGASPVTPSAAEHRAAATADTGTAGTAGAHSERAPLPPLGDAGNLELARAIGLRYVGSLSAFAVRRSAPSVPCPDVSYKYSRGCTVSLDGARFALALDAAEGAFRDSSPATAAAAE